MTDIVLKAKETLKRLEADLVAKTDHSTFLQSERRKISFDAHGGNAKAKTRLDALNAQSLESGLQIENLKSAIDEANARLASAEHQVGMEAEREKAREVTALATLASRRGLRIRDLTQELAAEISGAVSDLRRFGSLGAPVMNVRLLQLALTRSILPQLRESGIDVELIPIGNRHQADVVVDGFVAQATKWANGVLHHEKEAA